MSSYLHGYCRQQPARHAIILLNKASPVAWYNINLKGTYNFELSDDLPELEDMMRSIDGYMPV